MAYRACAGHTLRQMAFPYSWTGINPRRKPMPCRVVWPISMISPFSRRCVLSAELAKSSAKLVVMHSCTRRAGDRARPAGDIINSVADIFDARITALTGPVSNATALSLIPASVSGGCSPKPRSRCWRGSIKYGLRSFAGACLSSRGCSARAHRPWSGGYRGRDARCRASAAAGASLQLPAHTSRAPCATGWRYWRR